MTKYFRKITAVTLLPILCAALVLCSFVSTRRAAGGVTVNLSFRESSAQTGDVITLDVSFSAFPSITRFGPIEIGYDSQYLMFLGMDIGSALEGFELTHEEPEDTELIRFSAVNAEAEEAMLQGGATEGGSDPTTKAANRDAVFSSDTPVVVASLKFRVNEQARGDVKAWLGTISGLRDSALENVVAGAGTGASIVVQAQVSSDATLASLSAGALKLEPEFDPGIFQYNATVSKNVTDVAVKAVAFNLNSKVTVEGESNLQLGNNVVEITVTAEDGEAVKVYTINIYRSDSVLVDGVQLIDLEGVTYDFVAFPESLVIPAEFYQSTCMVDGKEVPCFRRDGVQSVLIYVRAHAETSEPGLYVYNQRTDTMRRYEPGKMLLRSSLILTVVEKPANVMVPEGFAPAKITYGSTEIDGYVSKDKSTRIAYLKSEDGTARFYVIDSTNGDLYPYRSTATSQNLFLYLFIVCASIAVVEALIIGHLIYRKKHAIRRQIKPRRV
ncbi:MAG: cadherin-like beta sandwich domain-containing protein [Clostridiales bacterium]|nr:cadherin-like beta sandwich domain-containing protein [Clostridiales bacterium]